MSPSLDYLGGNRARFPPSGPFLEGYGNCDFPFSPSEGEGELDAHFRLQVVRRNYLTRLFYHTQYEMQAGFFNNKYKNRPPHKRAIFRSGVYSIQVVG